MLTRDDALTRLAKTAKPFTLDELSREAEVMRLEDEVKKLLHAQKRLLGVESQAKGHLTIKAAEHERNIKLLQTEGIEQYSVLSKEPFSWRNGRYPLLMVMSLTSPTVEFKAHWEGSPHWDLLPQMDPTIEALYADIQERMTNWLDNDHRKRTYSLTRHILIPAATKTAIAQATTVFGNNIYLVVETSPKDWRREEVVVVHERERDPLVIGVLHDELFLIDKFNTTSLENYIAGEWAHRQLGPGQ